MGPNNNNTDYTPTAPTTPTDKMKTFTLAALFACLLVASALADPEDRGRPGGFGPGGGSGGGATDGNGGSTVEDDDMAILFNSIRGNNGILSADTFSQLSAATSGHNGLEKLDINLIIKVVLVKSGDKTFKF